MSLHGYRVIANVAIGVNNLDLTLMERTRRSGRQMCRMRLWRQQPIAPWR